MKNKGLQFFYFDRWGNLIYKGNDVYQGWNGSSSKGKCPTGTYPFRIEYADETGKEFPEREVLL